ncbi:hypothetical protein PENSPDRAFT_454181 [Peniophora sp. CONT]|nr:hypothetical protein PENSPDRAFT_454181 [Peniophora sp. CONT]
MPPAQSLDAFGHHDPSPPLVSTLDEGSHAMSFSLHPSTMQVLSLSRHAQLRRRHTWDLVAGHPRDEPSMNVSTPGIGLENMASPLFLFPHRSTSPPVAMAYRLPFIILAAVCGIFILAALIAVTWLYGGKARPKLRMLHLKAKTAEKNMSWSMMRSSTSGAGSNKVDEKMEAESVLKRVTVVLDRMAQPEGAFRNEKYAVLQPQLPPLAVLRHDVPGTRHRRRSLMLPETQRKSKTVAMSALPRLPSLAPSPALFTIDEGEERRAAERLKSSAPPGSPIPPAPSSSSQAQKSGTRSSSMTMGLAYIAGMANVFIDAASTSLASLSSLESIDLADKVYDGIEPPPTSKSAQQTPMTETISFASTPTPSASESYSAMSSDDASLFTPSLESNLTVYQVQRVQKLERFSGELRRASLVSYPEVALEGSKQFPSVVVTTSPSIAASEVRRASLALEMAAASSQSSTATASTYACLDDFPAPPAARRMSLSEEIESSLPGSLGWRKVLSASDPDLTQSAAEEKERVKETGFARLVRASDPPRLSGLGLGFSFLR